MSTRPTRTSGNYVSARQQQSSAVENFKPKSEWKHEEGTSFLLLYLPGFAVDQLTITPDYFNGTVKVEGKRRLPNNRLMPVDETFNVPQHLDLSKMDKQFGRGILMLKIPTHVNLVSQQQQQSVEDNNPKLHPETKPDSMTDPPKPIPSAANKVSIDKENEEKSIDNQTAAKQEISDEAAKGSMRAETNVVETVPSRPIEQETDSSTNNPILTTLTKTEEQKLVDNGKRASPETESVVKNNDNAVKNDGSHEKSKGSAAKVEEKVKANNEISKEEKTLIVNMGIAVVVIMGLGVSLLYTLLH